MIKRKNTFIGFAVREGLQGAESVRYFRTERSEALAEPDGEPQANRNAQRIPALIHEWAMHDNLKI